jgi:hypothetical protein
MTYKRAFSHFPPPARFPEERAARLDPFRARLSENSRGTVDRLLEAWEGGGNPGHGTVWRRLASALATLTRGPVETVGKCAVRFFVPDGIYRMQAFALEDLVDGSISVYADDVFQRAVDEGIVPASAAFVTTGDQSGTFRERHPERTLLVEMLTAASTRSAPEYYRHMLGWNRRAMRVGLSTATCTDADVRAVEAMCRLAAPPAPEFVPVPVRPRVVTEKGIA